MPGRVASSPARAGRVLRTNTTPKNKIEDINIVKKAKCSSRTRAKIILSEECVPPSANVDDVTSSPRRGSRNSTPNRAKINNKENSSRSTPNKRKGDTNDDALFIEISPAKSLKCNYNGMIHTSMMSPTVRLSKLSLDSPKGDVAKSPLRATNGQDSRTKRRSLFSPSKGLDSGDISDMLFCENKANVCDVMVDNSPTKKIIKGSKTNSNVDSVFKKPVWTPSKRRVESPAKRNGISPLKGLSQDKLEDMLCSPLKKDSPSKTKKNVISSPKGKKKVSPIKIANSGDLEDLFCSPVKPLSPPKKVKKEDVRKKVIKESPMKITGSGALEDLLCSPAKNPSPVKLPAVCNTDEKENIKNIPMRSPRKPMTPVKLTPVKGRANLFNSSPPSSAGSKVGASIEAQLGINKVDLSQLQLAKGALHTGTPDQLLCRSEQVNTMSKWLDDHLLMKKPGSLYVSGAPGTGKTATLTHLLNNKKAKYKSVFLNCMVLKSSIAIFKEVVKQLNPKTPAKSEKEALKEIEKLTTGKGEMILLVLDEIDQLESKNQDVLYTIFEWPALPASRLSLVGIANTLDLTDRVLPRLQIKESYKPTLIHYPPYSKQQIIEIITKRLTLSGVEKDVVTTRAITYLAGKISTLSGDIRKALDVCRRALEQAEINARKQSILKPRAFGSPLTSPQKGYKCPRPVPAKAGQVDLPQIMKVINEVYGSKIMKSMSMGGGGGLPTQQKILMASLLLLVKRGSSKEVTLGKLVQTYSKVCKKKGMVASDELECIGMVQGLEARGLISFQCKAGGAPRYAKVVLRLDENEVMMALEDKTLLSSIIDDVSCLE